MTTTKSRTCTGCGKTYMAVVRPNGTIRGSRCIECDRIYISFPGIKPPPKVPTERNYLEIVLPKTRKPWLDKKRNEWTLRVRVRKRGSDEKYKIDHIYLGLSADAKPEDVKAAYTAAYARLELKGASSKTRAMIVKKRNRRDNIKKYKKAFDTGRDKDFGVCKFTIKKVVYVVHLPDPLVDKKKHFVGRFNSRMEARKARDEKYKELRHQHVPCAVCGKMPAVLRCGGGILTHFSSECPNRVQMPTELRPLLQAKLWNLVFSKGDIDAGKLSKEDLFHMGYMHRAVKGFRFNPRTDVEYDFSLAKNYVVEREALFE